MVVDNLCNSSLELLKRVEKLTGSDIPFHKVDVRDKTSLIEVFQQYSIDGVIHFAVKKTLGVGSRKIQMDTQSIDSTKLSYWFSIVNQ